MSDGSGGGAVPPQDPLPDRPLPNIAAATAPAGARELEELLRQRACAAIAGAKQRNVARENQRKAHAYVHAMLARAVCQLGWVEDERQEREKTRRKANSWTSAAPGHSERTRRRDRKRESRIRCLPDYEEVPGGGQFLMMLLGRDGHKPSSQRHANQAAELSVSEGQDAAIRDDPAILHHVKARPVPCSGRPTYSRPSPAPPASLAPHVVPPPPRQQGAVVHSADNPHGAAKGLHGGVASNGDGAVPFDMESSGESPGDAQLDMESLLKAAGVSDVFSDAPELSTRQVPVSRASCKIMGKLNSLMHRQEDGVQQQSEVQAYGSPVIPPMPGFASIWGSSPGSGPSSVPPDGGSPWNNNGSPWGPTALAGEDTTLLSSSSPWAPLPPSAFSLHDGLAAAAAPVAAAAAAPARSPLAGATQSRSPASLAGAAQSRSPLAPARVSASAVEAIPPRSPPGPAVSSRSDPAASRAAMRATAKAARAAERPPLSTVGSTGQPGSPGFGIHAQQRSPKLRGSQLHPGGPRSPQQVATRLAGERQQAPPSSPAQRPAQQQAAWADAQQSSPALSRRRSGRHRERKSSGNQAEKELDPWDMPVTNDAKCGDGDFLASLPEFFRDSQAPAFKDGTLEREGKFVRGCAPLSHDDEDKFVFGGKIIMQ